MIHELANRNTVFVRKRCKNAKCEVFQLSFSVFAFYSVRFTMPKKGLAPTEWRQRLNNYAWGSYVCGHGERPAKSSSWATELAKIDRCPKHRDPASHDPFGRKIVSSCGYHVAPPSLANRFEPLTPPSGDTHCSHDRDLRLTDCHSYKWPGIH